MNEDFKRLLGKLFEKNGINVSDDMLAKFNIYKKFLIEYNEKVNLTAIKDPQGIAIKHFLDSAIISKYPYIKENAHLIDIGTGGGFPGVPLKIVRQDIELTLLDSLNKRIVFLNELCNKIDIKARTIHARAEECRKNKLAGNYDVVVSRAVAPLNILLELCLPYLKNNGVFIAMKGSNIEEELKDCKGALKTLNSEIEKTESFMLEEEFSRCLVIIRKKGSISTKYPRIFGKIKKSPL